MFLLAMEIKRALRLEKRYTNKRKLDEKVRSCRFICANEGHRLQNKKRSSNKVSKS
jgi:hypothetical protein